MVGFDQLNREATAIVLRAVSAHPVLGSVLVLKGALAAEAVTQRMRSTRDIDLAAARTFVSFDKDGEKKLKAMFRECLEDHLDAGNDPGWSLSTTSATKKPSGRRHPFGWDGYLIKVTLLYRGGSQQIVPIDLSFDDFTGNDMLLDCTATQLTPAGSDARFKLRGYSAEEQIAEKMRAFLQKRPRHLRKMGYDAEAEYRVRDIRDIHHLVTTLETSGQPPNWAVVGDAFRKKCRTKFVDCDGMSTFLQGDGELERIEAAYRHEFEGVGFPADAPFLDAWATLERIVIAVGSTTGFPGVTPLPEPRRQ